MVIPIYDSDPLDTNPYAPVTWGLIVANVLVFLLQLGMADDTTASLTQSLALIPAQLIGSAERASAVPAVATLATYMFLHGGWMHIISNMLFLWVLGDNIEDALGPVRFLVFYLLCGIAGGIAFVLSTSDSAIPLVGASGAVAGIVAAYLMIRPCAKVTVLVLGAVPLRLASVWVLGFWALLQVWNILSAEKGETAWWAHVGGLAAGAALVVVMRRPGVALFDCLRPEDVRVRTTADSGHQNTPRGAR